jgi:hypothetical protein
LLKETSDTTALRTLHRQTIRILSIRCISYMISNEQFFTPLLPVISSLKFKDRTEPSVTTRLAATDVLPLIRKCLWAVDTFRRSRSDLAYRYSHSYPGSPNVSWKRPSRWTWV